MAKKKITGSGGLPDFLISSWNGLNTSIKNEDDLLPGSSPDALNWITSAAQQSDKYYGDHIELRRGTSFLQETAMSSSLSISGLGVGTKQDGTQIPVFSIGRKLYYYNATTNANVEIGTDILPVAASGEDICIIPYQSLSGYYLLISSPNSSIYKINLADPGNIVDFQSFDLRGKIITSEGRSYLWGRQGKTQKDLINLYLSYIDAATYTQSPPITAKTGISGPATDGVTKTFSGTLTIDSFNTIFGVQIAGPISALVNITGITKAANAEITAAGHGLQAGDAVVIAGVSGMTQINNLITYVQAVTGINSFTVHVDSTGFTTYGSGGTVGKVEQFSDDQNGKLISDKGGTGTINYVTGAYSVTFINAPSAASNLTLAFYKDGSLGSIAKFNLGTPTAAGDGVFLPQQGFGAIMNVVPLSGLYFCFHQFGTYLLSIANNDVATAGNVSNTVYRNNVGIPYWRSAYPTGEGIPYLDTLNLSNPKLRILTLSYSVSNANPAIIPESISDQIDLSGNVFNKAVVYEWGDYYLLACKGLINGKADVANQVTYFRNKKTGFYDKTDYRINCAANYYGALLVGDSIGPNPLVLFSGFDDLGYNINNYWNSPQMLLGWKGMKAFNRLVIKGLIQKSQDLEIWLSFDGGQYVKYAEVGGNSQYVGQGVPVDVGGPIVGTNVVGGGGTVFAHPYEAEFKIASDRFNRVSFMIKGTGIGYLSVDSVRFGDIRLKSGRIINNLN